MIRQEAVAGLGVLVVVPEDHKRGFISLTELRSSRSTHKLAGSRTVPMESLEVGETQAQTLERLTKEEIQLRHFTYDPSRVLSSRLVTCELRPGVRVPTYLLQVPPKTNIIVGSEAHEVADLRWTPFEEVLEAPKCDLSLRPGTREAILSYLDFSRNNGGFKPAIYKYSDLKDPIPDEVFDMVEAGLSVKASLFRLKLASAPFARSLLLVHSQSPQASFLGHVEAQ